MSCEWTYLFAGVMHFSPMIVLFGWGLARIFRTPEAQPAAPPTR